MRVVLQYLSTQVLTDCTIGHCLQRHAAAVVTALNHLGLRQNIIEVAQNNFTYTPTCRV